MTNAVRDASPRSEGAAFPTRRGVAAVAAAAVLAGAANDLKPLNIVWFAGGGGSSEGMREAGFDPDYALNHNGTALAMHQVNHPDCTHLCDDAMAVHPMTLEPGRRIRVFWASPDCTHFSVARGAAPKSPRIRGLAWCVIPWAKLRQPDVILLENVKEFMTWGPLHPEGHPRAGHPIKERAGETFRRWTGRLEQCGYQVEFKVLCAADYGAPTTRRRLFMIARRDGHPIVWPQPTHAPRKDAARLGLKPYASAASIIDWNERCPSIFMSQTEAKAEGLKIKRPLVGATQSRIAKGIERYVIGSPDPFIVPITHSGERRCPPVTEPLATVTSAHRGEFAVAAPLLVGSAYGDGRENAGLRAWDARDAMRTITGSASGGFNAGMAYLVPSYGEAPGQAPRTRDIAEPYPTAVQHGNGGHLTVATLDRHFGTNASGADIQEPTPTVMSEGGGGKMSVITANLTSYYGTGVGSSIRDGVRAITGEDRHALTTVFMEQANTGRVGHDAREGVSTITGRATQQRLIETRLEAIGATPSSRRRAVLEFLWRHFGAPTEAEWADPTGTTQARLRFGLVVIGGSVFEIADIGMRMLKPRELFCAQGFRAGYIIDRDPYGNPITGTAATLMVGNSVPPPLARALCEANLNDNAPLTERVAA